MLATYGFVNFCGMRTLLEGVCGMWASCKREVESLAIILTTEQECFDWIYFLCRSSLLKHGNGYGTSMRQSRCPGIASKLQPGASVQEEGSCWLSSGSLLWQLLGAFFWTVMARLPHLIAWFPTIIRQALTGCRFLDLGREAESHQIQQIHGDNLPWLGWFFQMHEPWTIWSRASRSSIYCVLRNLNVAICNLQSIFNSKETCNRNMKWYFQAKQFRKLVWHVPARKSLDSQACVPTRRGSTARAV